jgi:fermentation-respiration switch protein FrsA (DUF1100 family)
VLTLLRILAVAAVIYVAVVALLYMMERTFLYPASSQRTTVVEAGLPGFQDLTLTTADGERLVAWWKPPEPGRALLVYFHGNGGSLWNRRYRARLLAEDGRGLLMVSYRGYSGSTGVPTETGLREDARAAYAWATERVEPKRVVLYGESLGSGVAVRLASEHPVGGLILEAPYTSTADVAKLTYWFVPVDLLMRDQFRSIDRIAEVKAPLLFLHGERDGLIPIHLGQKLYEAANGPKRFVRLPSVSHLDVLEQGGLAPVRAFLAEVESASRG